jgi:hypothetical protein
VRDVGFVFAELDAEYIPFSGESEQAAACAVGAAPVG